MATNPIQPVTSPLTYAPDPNAKNKANGNGMLAQTAITKASTYDPTLLSDPTQWNIDGKQTSAGQLYDIIAKNSPLMQQAQTAGLEQAASRGLLNSSMAVGAAQDSVIKNATPLAQFDATQYGNSARFNAENENTFALKNNDSTNNSKIYNTTAQNHASDFNAAAANQVGLANSDNLFKQSMNKENITSNEAMQAAQLESNRILQEAKLASDASLQSASLGAQMQMNNSRIASDQAMQSKSIEAQYGLAKQGFGFDVLKYEQQRQAELEKAAQAAGFTSARDAALNGFDVEKAANLSKTNLTMQEAIAQSDLMLANVNNNATMDRTVAGIAGDIAKDFNNSLAAINADPYMTQQAKSYAINQMFTSYKGQISMIEQVGTVPDVSNLLSNLIDPKTIKAPSGNYYNMASSDAAVAQSNTELAQVQREASVNDMYAKFAAASATPKGGKMICTRLHEMGYMDDYTFAADDNYADLLARCYPDFLVWYQSWAKHVVNAMHGETLASRLLARGLWVFVKPWSQEMAHIMKARDKGHWFGKIMMKVAHWLYLFSRG